MFNCIKASYKVDKIIFKSVTKVIICNLSVILGLILVCVGIALENNTLIEAGLIPSLLGMSWWVTVAATYIRDKEDIK